MNSKRQAKEKRGHVVQIRVCWKRDAYPLYYGSEGDIVTPLYIYYILLNTFLRYLRLRFSLN